MDGKRSIVMGLLLGAATLPASHLYAADAVPQASDPHRDLEDQVKSLKSLNSPLAAEPVIPGTLDKPPQPVAPGTLDAPPKPIAPGTLDKNVINPDAEIQGKGKPIPR